MADDGGGPVSPLAAALADYLALRRSMGFRLERAGRLLGQFVAHCEAVGAVTVTIDLALSWASLPEGPSRCWVAHRLSVVRGFARYLAVVDERTEVPPTDLLPGASHRATPYLYSVDEVRRLMAAAGTLRSPLRRATMSTLVGLLWVSGMRIGEAIGLDRADVDLEGRVLAVRSSKSGDQRVVPVQESTAAALRDYTLERDRLCPKSAASTAFFVSVAGTRLLYCNFHLAFLGLVREAGLTRRSATCRPRPHDLRHSFAVSTLVDWYEAGDDVEARLPVLSTFLGHVHPANTYWYLSGSPELLGAAAARLEAYAEAGR